MATIRRTDIIQKKYSKGRPAKSKREITHKRQEAYRWRDARRVYLASSFDRWRKLRSTLKLKDYSLAWHLMEAHEKSQCSLCRHSNSGSLPSERQRISLKNDKKEFLPSLIASVRQLCHKYFDFEDSIEIVGLICLEFDKCRKENFSLNELIKSGLKPAVSNYISEDLQDNSSLSNQINCNMLLQSSNDIPLTENCQTSHTIPSALNCLIDKPYLYAQSNEITNTAEKINHFAESLNRLPIKVQVHDASLKETPLLVSVKNDSIEFNKSKDCHDTDIVEDSISKVDFNLSSDSEPSLEIDIEKMDTSQEDEIETSDDHNRQQNNALPSSSQFSTPFLSENTSEILPLRQESTSKISNEKAVESKFQRCDAAPESNGESPLDMSMLKSTVKQEPVFDGFDQRPDSNVSENVSHKLAAGDPLSHQTRPHFKKKMTDVKYTGSNKQLCWSERLPTTYNQQKEELQTCIPWQRRDMSRKEEYEYLEFHPFSDLAEFSQHYPHVHQRTYYRWKRRIKEEFIILEQCPEMSFQDFSSIVLQAKESVYHLWKSLISQGKGFFTPSDSSKRIEAKCSIKSVSHSGELLYLQKNLSINYDQFCQQYPGVSVDIFNVMKRKVMQEFWLYYQNQHMNFKEFSKLANVPEEVFIVWKDYIDNLKSNPSSPSLISTAGVLSPSPSMAPPPFQSVGSPKSSNSSIHSHLSEDRIFSSLNGSSPYADSGSATSLNESIARNLSANYLASLQSMMFPWHNYYGMTSPLGQQMLPMMLWPQMIGLSNPLNLAPASNSASAALTALQLPTVSHSESAVYENQPDEVANKSQTFQQQGVKRTAADDETFLSCEKKMKVSSEKEDPDFWGSISRSRKQNKQEYVYYLKNPELGFKELESLFPSISLRTFYRWRKEMNAAVMLLEDNKDMNYHQFQMVFPDIPEEVFDLWKEKSEKNNLSSTTKVDSLFCNNVDQADTNLIHHTVKDRNEVTESTLLKSNVSDETTHHRKYNKEEYIFVQKNPDIDFATFSKLYPNISVRSFYRWKKELKDSVDYLKVNPAITYDVFRSMDSSATEEIFNIWKTLACNEYHFEETNNESSESQEDKDFKPMGLVNRKYNGPEYSFLQLNPYIEFSQFSRTYPDVPKRTFYRWKREIQQIINYIRTQPNVKFSDISVILPEVSQEIFEKWKDSACYEAPVDDSASNNNAATLQVSDEVKIFCKNTNDELAKNKMTEALLCLMGNPTVSFQQFSLQFDYVSPITFELWLKRIQKVLTHIASNPTIDYSTFNSNIKDITEDIFELWKNLGPDDMATIEASCEEAKNAGKKVGLDQSMDHQETSPVDEDILQKAYEYCQNNPFETDKGFQLHFPEISANLYTEWKVQINEAVHFVQSNPNITFEQFVEMFPKTKREIFNIWKYKSLYAAGDPALTSSLNAVSSEKDTHVEFSHKPSSCLEAGFAGAESDTSLPRSEADLENEKTITKDKVHYEDNVNKCENLKPSLSQFTKSVSSEENMSPSSSSNVSKQSFKTVSLAENLYKNNNNISLKTKTELPLGKVEALLHCSNSTSSHHLYNKTGTSPLLEAYGSNLTASNSSLSALMAMSGNGDSCSNLNQAAPEKHTPKKDHVAGNSWQSSPWGYVKDEDEAFSSQRQKKMSRAEYMFVKDNPDVDSQEFSRIFPQVSARTFYRWKKEIKAQLQMA
uniref:Uncharacterized protein n=1 Tax=Biomphalaria glabrata TaxID=6526 RepID=A0A2C9LKL6_BIOGL